MKRGRISEAKTQSGWSVEHVVRGQGSEGLGLEGPLDQFRSIGLVDPGSAFPDD